MVTLIVLAIFAFGFYTGYRSGLIMQGIRLIGYIITFVLATRYFDVLSEWVAMFIPFPAIQPNSELVMYDEVQSFYLDKAFYNLLTFFIIWLAGWVITNALSVLFTKVAYYDFLHIANRIMGGIINFLVVYFIVFMVLYLLSLLPIEFIQQQFVNNPLIFWIVDSTPILADYVDKLGLGV